MVIPSESPPWTLLGVGSEDYSLGGLISEDPVLTSIHILSEDSVMSDAATGFEGGLLTLRK